MRYAVDVGSASGPLTVRTRLWFQPIGYRWAHNLSDYTSFETDRFVRYYTSMASTSAIAIGEATEGGR